jgi:hypothetical protein
MAINILIAIVTRHKLLHAILMQKFLFSNKREICVKYTKICYKCLTWNIYNLYIKYTLSGLTIPLLLALLSWLSIESAIHGRWTIRLAWLILRQCLCRWKEVNTTTHLSQIHTSSSRPSRWGTHESYHGYRMTFK